MPKILNLRMWLINCSHNGLYEQLEEDYEFARNNLKIVRDALRKRRKRNNALKPPTK